jgi:hypothetical protein
MQTNRKVARLAAAALLSLAFLSCLPSRVLAQRGPDPIIGTWEVSIQGGPPGNIGFVIVHADGTIAETSKEDVVSPPVSSPGYGVWAHSQANNYAMTFKFFLVGPGPDGYCTAEVRQNLTLTDANHWNGPGDLRCFAADGTTLFEFPLTATASRMRLELLN